MKFRVRLPPKQRVRLPIDFDWLGYQAARDRFYLPNIPELYECKFIYGDIHEEGAHYCGKPVVEGSSWCKRHKKVCTRKLVDGEQVYGHRWRWKL